MKNPAFCKHNDSYYTQTKDFLLPLIPSGLEKVLDSGCGSGYFGRRLLELGRAKELTGVEIFEGAAEAAREFYHTVHLGDVELMDLSYSGSFDLVVCGDILEHLKDPLHILRKAHSWLRDEGFIVCCLPNIRYWKISYKLIVKGDWEYESQGIMDQTHLRFFTARSFKRLLAQAGFLVEREDMRIASGPKQEMFNKITFGLFKEFLGYQMMFRGIKVKL